MGACLRQSVALVSVACCTTSGRIIIWCCRQSQTCTHYTPAPTCWNHCAATSSSLPSPSSLLLCPFPPFSPFFSVFSNPQIQLQSSYGVIGGVAVSFPSPAAKCKCVIVQATKKWRNVSAAKCTENRLAVCVSFRRSIWRLWGWTGRRHAKKVLILLWQKYESNACGSVSFGRTGAIGCIESAPARLYIRPTVRRQTVASVLDWLNYDALAIAARSTQQLLVAGAEI